MAERTYDGGTIWERRATAEGHEWVEYSQGRTADRDAQTRQTIAWLSHWMDTAFEVPVLGWRFGLDALIGLVPGLGDVATTLVSLYILALAGRMGLPRITVVRMGLNVALDMLLGSLPLVGDLFDVWWKANQMNAALLEERLGQSPLEARRSRASDWIFVGAMIAGLVVLFAALVALVAFAFSAAWQAVGRLFGA
jgi:hypothetical protein